MLNTASVSFYISHLSCILMAVACSRMGFSILIPVNLFAACRKLTWIYPQGTCHVKGNFDKSPIELIVSTLQASILLLFNDSEELSYQEIQVCSVFSSWAWVCGGGWGG